MQGQGVQPATDIPWEGSRSSAGRGAGQSICMGGSCYQKGDEGRNRGYKMLGIVPRVGCKWLVISFYVPSSHFSCALFTATSEDEVNMWIKGLNWLVADTLRAPTPLQIER